MLNEVTLIAGAVGGAVVSGLAGLLIDALAIKKDRARMRTVRNEMAWEHHSPELARNLLVLETVADEIESTPIDIAVRARLTPAEMQQATGELSAAGLVDQPSPNLVRLTGAGRDVLAKHKIELEESSIQRSGETPRSHRQNLEDLDSAIEHAVAALRTQHAH